MFVSKAEELKSISNEGFEVEINFGSDDQRCECRGDEEMRSSEILSWSLMFDFRFLSLSMLDVDSNLEFFGWMKLYSIKGLDN